MNDMELLSELAQQTPLPAPAELSAARGRLTAAIAASQAARHPTAAAVPPGRQPLPGRRQRRPRRRLVLTGAVVAAVSAAAAAVLVSVWGLHAGPGANPAAAQVLHRAALAALQQQAGAPRPGQFVYTKIEDGDGSLYQSWLSVDGTSTGLIRGAGGGPASIYAPGCRGGRSSRSARQRQQAARLAGRHASRSPPTFPACPPACRRCAPTLSRPGSSTRPRPVT